MRPTSHEGKKRRWRSKMEAVSHLLRPALLASVVLVFLLGGGESAAITASDSVANMSDVAAQSDRRVTSLMPSSRASADSDAVQGVRDGSRSSPEQDGRSVLAIPPPPAVSRIDEAASVPELSALAERGPYNKVEAIVLHDEADVVIDGVQISNPTGDCIQLWDVQRVTIRNSKIGPCLNGINIFESTDVNISGTWFTGTTKAIYATSSTLIAVEENRFIDAGRNFVQFNTVTGTGNRVVDNIGENRLGGSEAEDLISLYSSSGTATSPILVARNILRNGGPSSSGSGIMAGDNGGAFQEVRNNILLNPGQVGIGVASGTDIVVADNLILGEGLAWSNVGVYVWNQYNADCARITLSGNRVDWTNRDGAKGGFWDGKNCGPVSVFTANDWLANLTPEVIQIMTSTFGVE